MLKDLFARRHREPGDELQEAATPVQDAIEDVPLAILVLNEHDRVIEANAAARVFFGIEPRRLPLTVIEATREVRMEEAVAASHKAPAEARLVHKPSVVNVSSTMVGAHRFVFVTDVTELRRLETVRQEFIANLSHELRTPLASLRLAAESLLDNPPPDVMARFARRVIDEAENLQDILDNLGELTAIEAGSLRLSLSTFSLHELVEEVVTRARVSRHVDVEVDPTLQLHADRSKVGQVLANLLDNAAKFSPDGTAIKVQAQRVADEAVISVRDHGRGISPEHWEKVFERFYKVDPARTRDLPGSGLGLAITKHLVIAHGGHVSTRNAEEGGQVFTVVLPARTLTAG